MGKLSFANEVQMAFLSGGALLEADQKTKLDDILETYSLPRPAHETGEARELRAIASWNELGRSQVLGGRQWYRTDRWQRLRRRVLSEQPFCAMREQRERCRLVATEVDHIKPHRGDRRLFFDRANLQPMCRSCHAQKTAREVLGKGQGWDEHGMPLDPHHHWNRK